MNIQIRCSHCSKHQASFICFECKKQYFCSVCLKEIHITYLKSHKIEEITKDLFDKRFKNENSCLDNVLCNLHPLEYIKFFCEGCNSLICSSCITYGKHSKHKYTSIREKSKIASTMIENAIQTVNFQLGRIDLIEKQMEIVHSKEVSKLKELNANLSSKIYPNKNEAKKLNVDISQINDYKPQPNSFISEIITSISDIKENLKTKLNSLTLFSNNLLNALSNIENINLLIEEIKLLATYISDHENKCNFYSQNDLKMIETRPKQILKETKQDSQKLEVGIKKTELPFNNDCINNPGKPLALRSILRFSESSNWNLKKLKKIPVRYEHIPSCFYDPHFKKYYCTEGTDKKNWMFEVDNIDRMFEDRFDKLINFQTNIEGIYSIAYKGYLFFPLFETFKIGKVDSKDGKLTETLDLGLLKSKPSCTMIWGGGANICLFNDLSTMKQYVMYEKEGEEMATLSELICFPTLAIVNSKKLPFPKKFLAHAFIYDSFFYLGSQLLTNKIEKVFDLMTYSFLDIPSLYFSEKCYNVYQMNYFPSESTFIISDYNTFIRFHAGI